MHMTDPKWLWTLVLPGVLALYYLIVRRRPNVRWHNQANLKKVMIGAKGIGRHIAALLVLLVMAIFCVGATRPTFASSYQEPRSAVMLVLDVSTSMTATDVAPTRLEAAKAAMLKMIKDAPAALNIGLATVAGNAKLVVSPTLDRSELLDKVQNLTPEPGGTATGEGIITATDALSSVAGFGSDDPLPARIFLVSDGKEEIKAGLRDTDVAVVEAKKSGYPVFTVNYGTQDGEINGQPIRSDPETLTSIAVSTGGQSFQAATQEELTTALNSIPGAMREATNSNTVPPLTLRYIMLALLGALGVGFLVFCRR